MKWKKRSAGTRGVTISQTEPKDRDTPPSIRIAELSWRTAHTICRNCFTKLSYTTGNTSNMQAHLWRHHPYIDISGTRKKPQKQETFPTAFRIKLQANSDRAQTISKAICVFMALDMRPFSVVENDGFTHLLSVLEPRYC